MGVRSPPVASSEQQRRPPPQAAQSPHPSRALSGLWVLMRAQDGYSKVSKTAMRSSASPLRFMAGLSLLTGRGGDCAG